MDRWRKVLQRETKSPINMPPVSSYSLIRLLYSSMVGAWPALQMAGLEHGHVARQGEALLYAEQAPARAALAHIKPTHAATLTCRVWPCSASGRDHPLPPPSHTRSWLWACAAPDTASGASTSAELGPCRQPVRSAQRMTA